MCRAAIAVGALMAYGCWWISELAKDWERVDMQRDGYDR